MHDTKHFARRHTVLVVDDESSDIETLRSVLEGTYRVLSKKSVRSALAVLEQERVDLVLLDVLVGGRHTYGERMLFTKPGYREIPVIFISRLDAGQEKADAFAAGAADYITKSASAVEIRARVASQLERAQQLRALMGQFFSPDVLERMEYSPDELLMSNREIITCFWDIRGFSRLCETVRAHPDGIAKFLGEYFELAASEIYEHGGLLDKFIGDGVMAIFGAWPPTKPDLAAQMAKTGRKEPELRTIALTEAALAATRCALKLQEEFTRREGDWREEGWARYTNQLVAPVRLACGINRGDAVVGRVGTKLRDQFTAIGPSVNLCSRIASVAGKEYHADGATRVAGLTVVSATINSLILGHFLVTPLGDEPIEIPGLSDRYRLFAVHRERREGDPSATGSVPKVQA